MSLFDIQKQPIVIRNETLVKGQPFLNEVLELIVGSGDDVMMVDAQGARWGSRNFDDANAFIKVDGTYKLKDSSGNVLIDSLGSGGDFVNVINSKLNTDSQEILADFDFGTTDYAGAVKTGDITWNTSTGAITGGSGVVVYRDGIVGASSGTPTFTIDATTGDATFAGTLSAPDGTLGTITAGTITGATVQTASSGYRLKLNGSNNRLEFLNNDTVLGYMTIDASGDVYIDADDDVLFSIGGTAKVGVFSGSFRPNADNSYDLGTSSKQFNDLYLGGICYVSEVNSGGSQMVLDVGTKEIRIETDGDIKPGADNDQNCGTSSSKWKDVKSYLINGSAYIESNLMGKEQKEYERKNDCLKEFEQGDVLIWRKGSLYKSNKKCDSMVVAIASIKGTPCVLGAEPVKVIGKVKTGDWIITSDKEGYGVASKKIKHGAVIAQALEDKFKKGPGIIKAMIRKL